MDLFEAGFGPKQIVRILQWGLGVPITVSFILAMIGSDFPDPALLLMQVFIPSEWWARVALGVLAFGIELSDVAIKKADTDFMVRTHEIVKGIGDRLRAGAAVETAVAEACRNTEGPSAVFEDAISRADLLPFDVALRQAADECGSDYLQEVCYLVAEAVKTEGDTGGAIRRLGVELEKNHLFVTAIESKIKNPIAVMRGVGLFAVPPLYALLRWSFNRAARGDNTINLEPGAKFFFLYGAVGITVFDGLIFGQWDRLFARLPLAVAAVYLGLHWI